MGEREQHAFLGKRANRSFKEKIESFTEGERKGEAYKDRPSYRTTSPHQPRKVPSVGKKDLLFKKGKREFFIVFSADPGDPSERRLSYLPGSRAREHSSSMSGQRKRGGEGCSISASPRGPASCRRRRKEGKEKGKVSSVLIRVVEKRRKGSDSTHL